MNYFFFVDVPRSSVRKSNFKITRRTILVSYFHRKFLHFNLNVFMDPVAQSRSGWLKYDQTDESLLSKKKQQENKYGNGGPKITNFS